MITKKNLVAVLLAFCISSIMFVALPTRSQTTSIYDPWADVSGPIAGQPDGVINMRDIAYEVMLFNTHGNPINRTQVNGAIEFEQLLENMAYKDWYNGLIGYWKFNEGTGNVTIDSSGNNNNGTLSGTSWIDGKYGNALSFDGIDNYVAIPDLYSSCPTEITVSAWINSPLTTTLPDGEAIIRHCRNGEFGLQLFSSGVAGMLIKTTSATPLDVRWNISSNEWHQIVGTWKKGDSLKLYVDGVLVNQTAVPDEFLYNAFWIDAAIGSDYRWKDFFNGTLDEMMVYNRSLNAEEIMLHYLLPPPETVNQIMPDWRNGLIGYWKLDEGNGSTTNDSSGNGINGTLNGPTWSEGQFGKALSFDGNDDYVVMDDLHDENVTSLTISAWINSPFDQIGYVFYSGTYGEFLLGNGQQAYDQPEITGNDTADFSVHLSNGIMYDVFSTPMTPNTWHFLTGVWTKGSSIKIYVDGVLSGENDAIPDSYLLNVGTSYGTRIGDYGTSRGVPFYEGSVDNIMVYNRTLTAEEVQLQYLLPPPP